MKLADSTIRSGLLAVLGVVFAASLCQAQANPPVHYQHGSDMPPGMVGRQQLERGGPLRGYFQPVEIRAPEGTMISVAVGGAFEPPQPAPVKIGLLIGQVYRLRVSRIPRLPDSEVCPTIEVVNRLYPPFGEKERFPIPIELLQEELEAAVGGRYVTRVIYLENPNDALPIAEKKNVNQRVFEVQTHEDPLQVADQLGRPMSIIRMGSRLPDQNGPDDKYLYGSPPLIQYGKTAPDQTPLSTGPQTGLMQKDTRPRSTLVPLPTAPQLMPPGNMPPGAPIAPMGYFPGYPNTYPMGPARR